MTPQQKLGLLIVQDYLNASFHVFRTWLQDQHFANPDIEAERLLAVFDDLTEDARKNFSVASLLTLQGRRSAWPRFRVKPRSGLNRDRANNVHAIAPGTKPANETKSGAKRRGKSFRKQLEKLGNARAKAARTRAKRDSEQTKLEA